MGMLHMVSPTDYVQKLSTISLDIVVVHGLNGHYERTWTKESCNWISALLPGILPAKTRSRIMAYEYNSRCFGNTASGTIFDFGANLCACLDIERQKTLERDRPIVFIAHSMGGLVVESCILISKVNTDERNRIARATKGVIFFGTPHGGSGLAPLGSVISNMSSIMRGANFVESVNELRKGSVTLHVLSHLFGSSHIQSGYSVLNFVETKASCGLTIVKRKDSVIQTSDRNIFLLDASHGNLAKFSGENDPLWHHVRGPMQTSFRKLSLPVIPSAASAAKPNTAPAPGEHFYLREEELLRMKQLLISHETSSSDSSRIQNKGVILSGDMPHTGCTQLALTFCQNHRHAFKSILWFNAETDDTFRESCYKNAQALDLVSNMERFEVEQHDWICTSLRDFFGSFTDHTPSLFVIDDTRDLAPLRQLLPGHIFPGSVIVIFKAGYAPTSLSPDFSFFNNVAVNHFPLEIASDCFIKVLNARGYSPLKEEKVVLQIVQNCITSPYPMSFTNFAEHISKARSPLNYFMHPKSLIDALKILLNPTMTDLTAEERLLLSLFALLTTNQTGIKTELFQTTPENSDYWDHGRRLLSHPGNSLTKILQDATRYQSAIEKLCKENYLLPASDGGLYINTVLQSQIILDNSEEERNDIWRLAVTLLYRFTAEQHLCLPLATSRAIFQQWLPNLQALLECSNNPTFSLINECSLKSALMLVEVIRIHSWFLYKHCRYNEISKMLGTARHICTSLTNILANQADYPLSMETVKVSLANIYDLEGSIFFERNQGIDCLAARREAFRLTLEAIPPNETEITNMRAKAAHAEIFFGERLKGREMLEECLSKGLKTSTGRRWQVNLALYWLLEGNLDESFKMICEALLNEDDPIEIARMRFVLGKICLSKNDFTGARNAFQECLRLRKRHIPSHYHVALTEHKIGVLMMEMGYVQEAVQVLTPAVSSLRCAEPETCSKLFVRSAWTLADALYNSNEGMAAIKLKIEAMERIDNEGIKGEDLEVVMSKNKIGLKYWDEVYTCKGMDEWVVFAHR